MHPMCYVSPAEIAKLYVNIVGFFHDTVVNRAVRAGTEIGIVAFHAGTNLCHHFVKGLQMVFTCQMKIPEFQKTHYSVQRLQQTRVQAFL